MSYNFNLPSITGKNADEKIQQLLSYIYKLVGDLNYFANQSADTPRGGNTIVGNDADSTSLAMIQRTVRDLQSALNKVKVDIENLPDVPSEVEYLVGVTENIQTQIDEVNEAIAGIEIPTLPTLDYLPLSGGVLTGKTSIDRTAENKTEPTDQDLAINYYLPNGGALTERNAPGIGFHIKNIDWANLIFDGMFKFMNYNFTAFAPVQASNFIGHLIGNADTATKAIQDGNGNDIAAQLDNKADSNHTHVVVLFDGSESNQIIAGQSKSINFSSYRSIRVYYHMPGSGGVKEMHMMYKTGGKIGATIYPDYYYDGVYAPTPDGDTRLMSIQWGIDEAKTTFTVRRSGWFDSAVGTWNERTSADYGVIRIEGVV